MRVQRRAAKRYPRKRPDLCEVRCVDERKVARARPRMKAELSIAALSETFRVLGDPTRLRIVHALSGGELCMCEHIAVLADSLGMPPEAGKVDISRRAGRVTISSEYEEAIQLPGMVKHVVFRPSAAVSY